MKKSRSVVVVTVATLGLAIGCSSSDQAVCVDAARRVTERRWCENDDGSGRYFWHHHSAYGRVGYPTIGSQARSGGKVELARSAVSRGGFGGTARGRTASA